ncbi:MAG: adenylyltransferase/cytidyltransferase family protein [Phycisphaerae bacterium]|nr:adenylyltransferase/cytidyltransferase family protein [Phycisphaerae bacterium]
MTASFESKIVGLDALAAIVEQFRAAGKTIVQCHGCFDVVHPGHIRYLEFARQQGDVLIVSITGDAAIDKGGMRPYIPQELRAENLAALMCVDLVCITPEPTAENALRRIRPDLYIKGREYENSRDPGFLAEKAIVEEYGGRILFSSGEIIFSSTALIERLPRFPENESHRLNLVCRRHAITRESLEARLDRFRGLNVMVVGDIVLDRYVLCDPLGVASESPMISLAQRDERSYVGGAAIVARHVAALGARAFLVSAAAEDEPSDMVRDVLRCEGVENHLINCRPSLVEKTRFLADENKLFKVERAQIRPLDSVAERHAAMILEQHSRLADAVIFCDFGYGMITSGLLQRVLPALRQNVRILAGDISGARANLLNFVNVDLLCPSELEMRAMLHDYDAGLSSVAWQLLERTQARHLFVTLEKRGMVVFDRQSQQRGTPEWSGRLRSEQVPALTPHALDKLGCGDALLAASTLTLAAGGSLLESAYLGSAAAAIEIGMLGNHPVENSGLRAWLGHRRELRQDQPIPPPVLTPA